MAPPILKLDDIQLSFGGAPLLAGAGLQVEPGDRICLVGRNGSGKSTLMKIAAGIVEAQSGEVFRHPSSTIRYLEQARIEWFESIGRNGRDANGHGPVLINAHMTFLKQLD